MTILNTIFLPLQGFFYAIVYLDYINKFCNGKSLTNKETNDNDIELTCRIIKEAINLKAERVLSTYSIFVTTLNLGESDINVEKNNLDKWIFKGHDIYAIGVQECMGIQDFRKVILAHLGGKKEYIIYSSEIGSTNRNLGYHGFIGLSVFVKRDLVEKGYIKYKEPSTQVTATGTNLLLAKAENKGAVGLPFQIHDVTIGFATAHLPSDSKGKNKLIKRNESMTTILKGLILAPEPTGNVLQHQVDHLVFLGDLNYRINPPGGHADTSALNSLAQAQSIEKAIMKKNKGDANWMDVRAGLLRSQSDPLYPSKEVIENINQARTASKLQWIEVSKDDELRQLLELTDFLHGFVEPLPCFPPSYKRKKGADGDCGDYTDPKIIKEGFSNIGDLDEDRLTSTETSDSPNVIPAGIERITLTERKKMKKKLRPPSFTDRILIHSLHNKKLEVKCYEICDQIRLSDHRPVSMTLTMEADKTFIPINSEEGAGTTGMLLCSLCITNIDIKVLTNNNVESFYNTSLTSLRSNSMSSTSFSESMSGDVENPIHHSFSIKSKAADNLVHDVGSVAITFPLPSKDPIIEHKKVYDLSKSLRLGDSVSSLSKIVDIAEDNGVAGETVLKLNNTFIWLEKDDNISIPSTTSNDDGDSKNFSYSGKISVAGLIIPRTGCDVLLHIKTNEQEDIGECVVNLIDLITMDSTQTTRSTTIKMIPLTDGSRLVGHLSGTFSLTFLAECNFAELNEKR